MEQFYSGWSSFNAVSGGSLVDGIRYTGIDYYNPISITSITVTDGTATVITDSAHGLSTDDAIVITGADQDDYNTAMSVTVVDTTSFTFDTSTTEDATGTLLCYKCLRNRRGQILTDGQILGAMALVPDIILDNLTELSAYETDADTILDFIKTVLSDWDGNYIRDWDGADPDVSPAGNWYYTNRFSTNEYVYDDQILAFNHSGGACAACLLYYKHRIDTDATDAAEFYSKAEDFMTWTRDYRTDTEDGERYWWPYKALESGEWCEDLNHGSYTFRFFKVAYQNGYLDFTSDELTKYTNAAVYAWNDSGLVGDVAERFDGTGDEDGIPLYERPSIGHFMWMAEFNSDLFKMGRDAIGAYCDIDAFDNYPLL